MLTDARVETDRHKLEDEAFEGNHYEDSDDGRAGFAGDGDLKDFAGDGERATQAGAAAAQGASVRRAGVGVPSAGRSASWRGAGRIPKGGHAAAKGRRRRRVTSQGTTRAGSHLGQSVWADWYRTLLE